MTTTTYLEYRIHTLSFRITHCTQAIPCHRTGQHARKVGDDEPHSTTTQTAYDAPELARGSRLFTFSHTLLAQHLLKDIAKLRVLLLFALLSRIAIATARSRAKAKRREGEAEARRGSLTSTGARARVFFGHLVGIEVKWTTRGAGVVAMSSAHGIVLAATTWVGERVVGVVDELEFFGARVSFGRVSRDTIRVRLECEALVGIANLLLRARRREGENSV